MQLTGKDIERQCDRARLLRGKALYASKSVSNLNVHTDLDDVNEWLTAHEMDEYTKEYKEESGIFVAEAKVEGNEGNLYNVYLVVDDNSKDKFLRVSCECKDYVGGTSFCKHCVAVAHNLVMKKLEEQLSDKLVNARELEQKNAANRPKTRTGERKAFNSVKSYASHSSNAIAQLIKVYSGVDTSVYFKDNENAKENVLPDSVELVPNLVLDGLRKRDIEFKIGGTKKYILKDMEQFIRMFSKKELFSYGKNLTVLHDRKYFTDESQYYIDMIQDLLSGRKHDSVYVQEPIRYLRLTDKYMEDILIRHMGKTISVNGAVMKVLDKNPKLTLKVKKQDNGAVITLHALEVYKGFNRSFVLDEKERCVYAATEGFGKIMTPFISTLKEYRDISYWRSYKKEAEYTCYLDENDYMSFCGYVLRKVSNYLTIKEEDVALEEYMPEECRIGIYLDMPSDDCITCNIKADYGKESYNVGDWASLFKGEFRDMEKEQAVYVAAKKYFPNERRENEGYLLSLNTEEEMYLLLEQGIKELGGLGDMYVSDRIRSLNIQRTPKVTAGVNIQGGLLELSVDIPDMSSDEIGEILSAYRLKRKYYRMKNGDFMKLDEAGLSVLSEISMGLELRDKEWEEGRILLPLYRANYIDSVMKERGKNMTVVRSSRFKSIIRGMREVEDSDYEVPDGIKAELRGYQKTGYRWLRTLSHYGFGGILADDMGLGKTLQIITLLQGIITESGYDANENISLIVCPASLVYNWESEFKKFAPDISTVIVVGNADERKEKMKSLNQADVIITSYDLLKRDLQEYEKKHFLYMIIDEAQYIKNANTQAAKAVKCIDADHRFALTGTPIENRLSDLWSIFDFLMKGYLYSYDKFRENYELPVTVKKDEEVLNRLQKMVLPFILRRRKKDVLKDLPDKIENVIYTNMTEEQKKYYNARYLKLKKDLASKSDKEFRESKMLVLSELTRLRQLCCDPLLFVENYKGGSGKVDAFLGMAEELIGDGSNILVFSQFATMLELLRDKLNSMNINTLMLTGKNSKEERRNMVQEFQEGKSTVFLISLKAGGTGLNLTAADTVIHFDPWWNVAAQNQAADRAHRIGQDKVVTVIQLVMKNSIEERIIELQNRKKELYDNVMEGTDVANAALTREEIMGLLEQF